GNRQRAADHPAEKSPAAGAEKAAIGIADELVDDSLVGHPLLGQWAPKSPLQLTNRCRRCDRSRRKGVEVSGRMRSGDVEDVPHARPSRGWMPDVWHSLRTDCYGGGRSIADVKRLTRNPT